MIKPEEKAKSLVERFRFLEFQENGKNYCEELTDEEAKQCALIALERENYVVESLCRSGLLPKGFTDKLLEDQLKVKTEIEKL